MKLSYDSMTTEELYFLIYKRMLNIPSFGSGDDFKIIKIDLINTLKFNDSKIFNKQH